MENNNQSLTTHFIKTADFKTHYVSGIFGGLTSNNQINMAFFIERNVIPSSITYSVDQNGIPAETGRDTKLGMVRETAGCLILDVEKAKSVVEWLNDRIAQAESNVPNQ